MNLPSSSVAGASSRKTVSRDPSSRDSSAAAPGRSFRNPLDAWLAGQCGVQDADANALARALREARARGAKAITGLGMLVCQGARNFTLWTGVEAPVDVMEDALKKEFE